MCVEVFSLPVHSLSITSPSSLAPSPEAGTAVTSHAHVSQRPEGSYLPPLLLMLALSPPPARPDASQRCFATFVAFCYCARLKLFLKVVQIHRICFNTFNHFSPLNSMLRHFHVVV